MTHLPACERQPLWEGSERIRDAYSLPSPWAASRRERLRLCTQSACRFSLIAYRTSLQYGKYSCVSSARSEEKSAEASCAQSLCAAALLFSRALFSTTLPTLGENGRAEPFPRFQPSNLIPLRFVQHHGDMQLHIVPHRGMGKEESGGLGEKTRKGKGDCSWAAPLPLGCLPKTPVNLYCVNGARRV